MSWSCRALHQRVRLTNEVLQATQKVLEGSVAERFSSTD
jgi:hypothetical protein